MANRYAAGAARLPFGVLRGATGTDLETNVATIACPFTGEELTAVAALNPDVAIVHAQRADAAGDTQVWGLLGCQKEAAFAADRVIVVVEELVDQSVIRADPNRTILPGLVVDAVVVEPWGAHPSYAQGYYDRDNAFYIEWDAISRDEEALQAWLKEWVHGVSGRGEYVEKLGRERIESLRPGPAPSGEVDYGEYR
jgi:glutaconate CoA-transferase, subunit A